MLNKYVDPCPRYLTLDDTHNRCIFCLGEKHARDVLEGEICRHWVFYEKALLSSVPLSEERVAGVCFPRFGTHRCRGTEENEIVAFTVGSGRWVREGAFLWRASVENEGKCSAGLCPGRAGDIWGWGSWDWTLSVLLPCVWRVIGSYGASKHFLAINLQLEWAFLFFLISCVGWGGVQKRRAIFSHIHRFSILVMLTLKGCVKMAMRECPLWKRW